MHRFALDFTGFYIVIQVEIGKFLEWALPPPLKKIPNSYCSSYCWWNKIEKFEQISGFLYFFFPFAVIRLIPAFVWIYFTCIASLKTHARGKCKENRKKQEGNVTSATATRLMGHDMCRFLIRKVEHSPIQLTAIGAKICNVKQNLKIRDVFRYTNNIDWTT